ncbi:hypothetical protein FJU08_13895 [Martelella alba]|uniref:PAS domain-containing protein n=1 Tax=Martelella alba TaxID=2590451 RepID=A0A506U7V6_9HYPH|nr:hypothetical protein [Martelella alba]TPW29426.1 hypothetical protein FJU08_13895 [Martelella alba]
MKKADVRLRATLNEGLRPQFGDNRAADSFADSYSGPFANVLTLDPPMIEKALRRAIPILIIAFLIAVATTRGLTLLQSHGQLQTTIQNQTELVATMAYAAFSEHADMFRPGDTDAAKAHLQALMSIADINPDTALLLIDTDGTVFAASNSGTSYIGDNLATLLPAVAAARHIKVGNSGALETVIDGTQHIVSLHLIGNDGAMVMAIHAKGAAAGAWRTEMNMNVTLFAATALLLIVLTYAYYAQLDRAGRNGQALSRYRNDSETMLAGGEAGLWTFDAEAKTIALASSALEALGLQGSAGPRSLRSLLAHIHPDDRRAIKTLLGPSDTGRIDATIRFRQRDDRYVRFAIRAQLSTLNERMSISGIIFRVTAGRAADTAACSGQMLSAAIEAVPQSVAIWGRNGRLLAANAHFRTAYGAGRDLSGLTREELSETATSAVVVRQNRMTGIGAGNCFAETQTTQGRWIQLDERRLPSGETISIGTDITRFKDNQNRLQSVQDRLRKTVNELACAKRRLEQEAASLKAALTLSRSPVTAERTEEQRLTHAMRTELTTVVGYCEIMMAATKQDNVQVQDYARNIHAGGMALQAIIEEMAQKEAGANRVAVATTAAVAMKPGVLMRRTINTATNAH